MKSYYRHIALVIFATIVGIGLCRSYLSHQNIAKKHKIVCGKLTHASRAKAGPIASYEFFYNGKRFSSGPVGCAIETLQRYESGLTGVAIIFNPNNPVDNDLLDDVSKFRRYGVDSIDIIGIDCDTW